MARSERAALHRLRAPEDRRAAAAGRVPLPEDYLGADAVVLVDGGTDLLLRGDEAGLGTPEEDMASLAALHGIDAPVKLAASLGFGIDAHHGVNHAQQATPTHPSIVHGQIAAPCADSSETCTRPTAPEAAPCSSTH